MLKMDQFGLETYSDSYIAAGVFAGNISYESIGIDTKLSIDYDIENIENIFTSEGMEDIKQKIKDMTSKAKANIGPWAKKLVNMVISWFMNIIGKSKDLKSKLGKHYKNAQTYISSLDELKDKAVASDETIAIKNWGKSVLQVLSLILVISASMKHMNSDMVEFTNNVKSLISNNSNDNEKSKIDKLKGASSLTLMFNSEILLMCATVLSMDMFDTNFSNAISMIQYDIEKWYNTIIGASNNDKFKNGNATNIDVKQYFNTKAYDGVLDGFRKRLVNLLLKSTAMSKVIGYKIHTSDSATNSVMDMLAEFNSKELTEVREKAKNILSDDMKKIKEPKEANVTYDIAFNVIHSALEDFMRISDKNRNLWDFSKYVKPIETTRRTLESVVKSLEDLSDNDSVALLKVIMDTGSFFGMLIKTVDNAVTISDSIIENLHKDVINLGRTLKKIK